MNPCKHYNLCKLLGTETTNSGDSFCILHSPNPNKSDGSFWDALRAYRSHTQFNYSNIVFPEFTDSIRTWFNGQPNHYLDFSNASFLGKANFSELNFGEGGTFSSCIFYDDVDFNNSSFQGNSDFTSALFKGCARLTRTKFMHPVSFSDAVFEQVSDFSANAFGQTIFNHVLFVRTKFLNRVSFHDVLFNNDVEFIETDFQAYCEFYAAEFRGEVNFDAPKFRSEVNFRRAKFKGVTVFDGRKTEPVFFGKAILEGVQVDKKDMLHFINVNLSEAVFRDAEVANIDFVGVRWYRAGKVLRRAGLYEEYLISNTGDTPGSSSVEKLYRQIKQNYEERRDFGRAGDFHMGEKEMRLINIQTPLGMRVLLALYKLTNGYGERAAIPLCCFTILILYGAIFALLGGLFDKTLNRYLDIGIAGDYFDALLFSLDKAFHLPGEYFVSAGSVRWIQTALGVFGPFFVGLFGLALRNRLRR